MFAIAYAVFIFLRIILKGNTGRAAWDYGSGCSSVGSVHKNSSVTWDKSNCQRVQSRKLCLPAVDKEYSREVLRHVEVSVYQRYNS